MALEDLLKGILGGAISGPGSGGNQTPDLTDILGGILGGMGGQPPKPSSTPQGGASLPDLGGGILGGMQGGGDLGGILGGILGGSSMANNAILGPITQTLSEQLGLDPKIAQMVVIFALTVVIPAVLKRLQGARPQGGNMPGGNMPTQPAGQQMDLDDLLLRMGSQRGLGHDYLRSTGLVQRLSDQTGLAPDLAEDSLQQTLFMLGQFMQEGEQGQNEEADLKSLLDEWDS